jgi:hypothetical protein
MRRSWKWGWVKWGEGGGEGGGGGGKVLIILFSLHALEPRLEVGAGSEWKSIVIPTSQLQTTLPSVERCAENLWNKKIDFMAA